MNQEQWYYLSENHEVEGPVSAAELKSLKSNMQITGETQICKGGEENWVPYGKALLIDVTPTPPQNISIEATPPPIPHEHKNTYYLGINGETSGPFDAKEIRSRWSKGELKDAFIYHKSNDKWVPLSELVDALFYLESEVPIANNELPVTVEKQIESPTQYKVKAYLFTAIFLHKRPAISPTASTGYFCEAY